LIVIIGTIFFLNPSKTFRLFRHEIPLFFGDSIDLPGSASGFPIRIRNTKLLMLSQIHPYTLSWMSGATIPRWLCARPRSPASRSCCACSASMKESAPNFKIKFNILFLLIFHQNDFTYTELWQHMIAKSIPAVDWLTFQGFIMFRLGTVLRIRAILIRIWILLFSSLTFKMPTKN
jgi:hypothetical protein